MKHLSSSTREIFRLANILFNNVDELEQIALFGSHSRVGRESDARGDMSSHAGIVLRNLTEFNLRNICGPIVYGAGVQEYSQGRVSEKRFWKNTLSGKLDESGRKLVSGAEPDFFEPTITLERNSKRPLISGGCGCSLSREGNLCAHMSALLIAWVRKPEEFVEEGGERRRRSEFDDARQHVAESIRKLADAIENSKSEEDLQLLQRTYSRLRLWENDAKEAGDHNFSERRQPENELRLEFSRLLNLVSFAIMSSIENKYEIGAIDLYDKATLSTFGRTVGLLADNLRHKKSVEPVRDVRRSKTLARAVTVSAVTTRSWDSLIENFSAR